MGAWGYGIRQDDLVCDVIAVFEDLLKAGNSVREATEGVRLKFSGAMKDTDEGPLVFIALADMQWTYGGLEPQILNRVKKDLESGRSLGGWRTLAFLARVEYMISWSKEKPPPPVEIGEGWGARLCATLVVIKSTGGNPMIESKARYWLSLVLLTIIVGAVISRSASAQGRAPTDWDRYMLDAGLAYSQGHYDEAEKQVTAALRYGKSFGSNDPRTARSLGLLGRIYRAQGRDAEAEKPFREALAIWKEILGPERTDLVVQLDELAHLYQDEGKYAEAEPLFKQGLIVMERAYGKESDIVALRLDTLAELYFAAGLYEKAEPLFKRALKIRRNAVVQEDLDVAQSLENHAKVLRKLDREAEAEDLEARAKSIRKSR